MNIYQKLKADHDRHRELMRRIADTSGDSDERKRLFDVLLKEVESHAAAEEQTLYSELIESVEAQPQTRHSVSEHKEASDYLEELQATDMSNPAWLMTFKKFQDALEHHMKEEENDVFELSEDVIDDDRAVALGAKFEGRKEVEKRRVEG